MRLADLTTLRLGGPVGRLVDAATGAEMVDAVRAADEAGEPVLVLGRVTDDPHLVLPGVEPLRVDELVDAFGGEDES